MDASTGCNMVYAYAKLACHWRPPAMSLFSIRRATSAPSSTDRANTETQSSR